MGIAVTELAFSDCFRSHVQRQEFLCPQCGGETLEEWIPPNYFQGELRFNNETYIAENKGIVKCVCLRCKIALAFAVYTRRENGVIVVNIHEPGNVSPLVERDGKWLTPVNVRRYQYFDEHGTFREEAYA